MSRTRVYDPVTNEPFDVPDAKATELRLEHGWLSHPFETVETPVAEEKHVDDDWRYSDAAPTKE